MKYVIIIEPTKTGFSAYSPDVPGCIATGRTADETREAIKDAIAFHIEGLKEMGLKIPVSQVQTDVVDVEIAA